jgi:hypothetical protein
MAAESLLHVLALRKHLDSHGFQNFWPDFESKLSDLFMVDPSDCRSEVVRTVPQENNQEQNGGPGEYCIAFSGSATQSEWVSNAVELETLLEVTCLTGL